MDRLESDFECRFAGLPSNGSLLVWEITNKCNLRCAHCCNSSNPYVNTDIEVSFDTIKKVIGQFKENKIVQVYFSGGEPLCRNDFLDILKLIDTDFTDVYIASNGTLLENDVNIKAFKEINFKAISISLDSHISTINDHLRNYQGAFQRTVNGIKKCVNEGITVRLSTMILPSNVDLLEEQLRFFVNLGVVNITLRTIFPVGRAKENREFIVDINAKFSYLINIIDSLNKEFPNVNIEHNLFENIIAKESKVCICYGGDNLIHIDSKGFTSSCSWLYKIDKNKFNGGNINDNTLESCFKKIKDVMTTLKTEYKGCPLEELTTNL